MRNDRAMAVWRRAVWTAVIFLTVADAPAANAAAAMATNMATPAAPTVATDSASHPAVAGTSERPGTPAPPVASVQPIVKPSAATIAAANELMSLQEDTVVLKAQLKKLDAQAQVAERQASLGKMGPSIGYDDVTVIATQSLGNASAATVVINDGDEIDVVPGDTLPNGMRVLSIRAGHVVVDRNGHRSTLAVSSQHSQSSRYAAAGMSMNVPVDGRNGMSSFSTVPLPSR